MSLRHAAVIVVAWRSTAVNLSHRGAGFPSSYTVSWRIRIFNYIEEVPRFFFPIEFNSAFQTSNYTFSSTLHHTQFNFYSWAQQGHGFKSWDCTLPWGSLWTELY
jgi:hypothetical protein